jgi:hypothetical protein
MSDVPRPDARGPVSRARWLLVAALLAPAVVLPLCVPLYDREDPALFGFPFYFWFQFLLIVGAVALTLPAYVVATGADRAERVARGLPPEPDGSGAHRDEGRR